MSLGLTGALFVPTGASGLPPAVGMQERDGAKSGGGGWQMGGGEGGGALGREEKAEESRWSLPGAGWTRDSPHTLSGATLVGVLSGKQQMGKLKKSKQRERRNL